MRFDDQKETFNIFARLSEAEVWHLATEVGLKFDYTTTHLQRAARLTEHFYREIELLPLTKRLLKTV